MPTSSMLVHLTIEKENPAFFTRIELVRPCDLFVKAIILKGQTLTWLSRLLALHGA